MRKYFIPAVLFLLLVVPPFALADETVSLDHLDALSFRFKGEDGRSYRSWAIYAEAVNPGDPSGPYKPVVAPGEGYACVDDVARIALVYLDQYEKTGDKKSFKGAVEALEFLLYMEDGKGLYYNFIDKKGKINREGHTSKKGLDWWTARAFRALGRGIRVIGKKDPWLYNKMLKAYGRTLDRLVEYDKNPQISKEIISAYRLRGIAPGSLVGDSGAITSIFTLGLIEKYKALPDERTKRLIHNYCSAMLRMEETLPDRWPFKGYHYPSLWNTDMVHFYGNRQALALAEGGRLFSNRKWIESAEREGNRAYPALLTSWGLPFALSPEPEIYPQIAYTAESIISNLMGLYRVTGKRKYAVLAGIFGSWFVGNNSLEKPVFIPERGLCYDGIDKNGLNTNAGAESTLEALLAMQALAGTPGKEYLKCRPYGFEDYSPVLIPIDDFEVSFGKVERVKVKETGGREKLTVKPAADAGLAFERMIEIPGDYRVYLIYRKEGFETSGSINFNVDRRDKTVYLPGSKADYHYKRVFLSSLRVRETGKVRLSLNRIKSKGSLYLDSIMVVPEFQKRMWKKDDKFITLITRGGFGEGTLPVELKTPSGASGGALITGDDVMSLVFPDYGWVMITTD